MILDLMKSQAAAREKTQQGKIRMAEPRAAARPMAQRRKRPRTQTRKRPKAQTQTAGPLRARGTT